MVRGNSLRCRRKLQSVLRLHGSERRNPYGPPQALRRSTQIASAFRSTGRGPAIEIFRIHPARQLRSAGAYACGIICVPIAVIWVRYPALQKHSKQLAAVARAISPRNPRFLFRHSSA